jgi:uncharacterized protein YraI
VRSGPGTEYAKVGSIPYGAKVNVSNIAGQNAWVEIELGKFLCVQLGNERNMEPN